MFAFRTTWIVKQGKMQEALELIGVAIEGGKPAEAKARVYTPYASPQELVFEETWESVEARDAFWDAYWQSPEGGAFNEKWLPLVERAPSMFIWRVRAWD